MYQNIPEELRRLPQWITWRYEDIGAAKPTKVPYDPKTGNKADVNNPAEWATFDITIKAANSYSGIGFVFTENDPYCFIDFDDTKGDAAALDRQIKIFRELDSYSEISPSGKGLHTIVKGFAPSGRRRGFIELYYAHRYATFTGNVYHNKPIEERQHIITQLWEQMGKGVPATFLYDGTDKEVLTDPQVIERALAAINGDKFKILHTGNWQELYQSQSEADFAYVDIIAFYTQNKTQITRIFHASPLGQRLKAKRKDYISYMLAQVFDRMLPKIDFDGFATAIDNKQLELKLGGTNAASSNGRTSPFDGENIGSNPIAATTTIPIPPGLMGEIAQFIYAIAPRQVPEIAIAGAIGLMAGICGRAYNVDKSGLNLYILMLAPTGTGKEAMAIGIDTLMNAIKMQVPTSVNFVGPSEIKSGQALIKHFSKSPCFVSILGEFGLRLQTMSDRYANPAESSLKRIFLDLFHKNGFGQIYRPTIYADSDKNIHATESPSFSILAESTPNKFYNILNEEMIEEGFLSRFTIIEYNGNRKPDNQARLNVVPSFQLIDRLVGLVANVEVIMHSKRVIEVGFTADARHIQERFDKFADDQINLSKNKEAIVQLWNRADAKARRIAALIAVGVNMSDPVIIPEYVQWAINMVQSDIKALSGKFESGEIGINSYEIKQLNEVTRVIKEYLNKTFDEVKGYCDSEPMFQARVIPYTYLNRRLMSLSCFRVDRMGSTHSLKRAIQTLIDRDEIREASKTELTQKFGTTQRCFVLRNTKIL